MHNFWRQHKYFNQHKEPTQIANIMDNELSSNWLATYKLTLNINKTH